MAFEIPQHLPRRALPQDVSSKILNRIDSAFVKDLDANLANSWVAELDESISATKIRIHERIEEDLPDFQRQVETSKSVQTRLQSLTKGVDTLHERISSPTGLLPTAFHTLQVHASLAQTASDATVIADSLSHLLKCKRQYTSVTSLIKLGKLPEAAVACIELERTCQSVPKALENARVMHDLKYKLQALKARVEEQLLETLSTILVVQASRLTIRSEVQIPGSDATVSLEAVLVSLAPNSLQDYLNNFRKLFTSYFIENVLQQPFSVGEGVSMTERVLNLIPTSPNSESRKARLNNLAHVFDFVDAHVFPKLPESQASSFLRSLAKPLTTNILQLFLAPQLPSSFGLLPPFLDLVRQAVNFEEEYVVGLLKGDPRDRPLKEWSDSLANHYERQRRNSILENCRLLIKERTEPSQTFLAEVQQPIENSFPTVVVNDEADSWGLETSTGTAKEDEWGFGDEGDSKDDTEQADGWGLDDENTIEDSKEEDNWGLDDDPPTESSTADDDSWGLDESKPTQSTKPTNGNHVPTSPAVEGISEDDDAEDAWGWNDDKAEENGVPGESPAEDAWDDPWGEPESPVKETKPVPTKAPKVAKRLEKLASKNKKHLNGASTQRPPSPPPVRSPIRPPPSSQKTIKKPISKSHLAQKPAAIVTKVHPPVEHYRVTNRTKRIVRMVEDAIAEGKQFAASNLFSKLSTGSAPGSTLFRTATTVLDLYQALYPVRIESDLQKLEGLLQFSNDCLYLADSLEQLEQETSSQATVKQRLSECKEQLNVLGKSWYHDALERECRRNDRLLADGTEGFTYTTDQDRYDDCESAISTVIRSIKDLARRAKPIVSKTKYYQAVGKLVDAALNRVLRDIVALPDITEVESHRLSELCHIFNALEGLFSEDPSQPSFVVAYVPSWLKFNYLSELLEASLADITYLVEEGALIDFEIDELINLVKALFADTPLRANTINKIHAGHSHSSQLSP